jgi:hypothetical protein
MLQLKKKMNMMKKKKPHDLINSPLYINYHTHKKKKTFMKFKLFFLLLSKLIYYFALTLKGKILKLHYNNLNKKTKKIKGKLKWPKQIKKQ